MLMRMTYILSKSPPPGSLFDIKQKAEEIFHFDLHKKKKCETFKDSQWKTLQIYIFGVQPCFHLSQYVFAPNF